VHCGDAAVEARLEQKIDEACISFEKKPQEVAQVSSQALLAAISTGWGSHKIFASGSLKSGR
jgi:hypothetical protein